MKKSYLSNEITDYIRSLKENIFNDLKNKIKIYLDMNLLIDFIKIENDILVNRPFVKELYTQIKRLIHENKAVVLISDIHVYEALKPKSDTNLKKLFTIMDKLSKGYCISDSKTIELNEILFTLRLIFSIDNAEFYYYREFYTKPIFLMQNKIPDMTHIAKTSKQSGIELQKNFIDFTWKMKLIDILDSVENKDYFNFKNIENEITVMLTRNRLKYSNEYSDFNDLFQKEIFGSFDLYKDHIYENIQNYFTNYSYGANKIADKIYNMPIDEKYIRILDDIIQGLTSSNQYGALPSICIGSGLHALKRYNENHPYDEGDSFDFFHAKRALPHADYFFTEKTLCGMIKDSRLKFDKIFKCKVISKLKEGVSDFETK